MPLGVSQCYAYSVKKTRRPTIGPTAINQPLLWSAFIFSCRRVTLAGTNFKADIDCARSAISSVLVVFSLGSVSDELASTLIGCD